MCNFFFNLPVNKISIQLTVTFRLPDFVKTFISNVNK